MTRLQFLSYIKRQFKRTDKNTEIYEALNETIKDIASRYSFDVYSFQSWIPCIVEQNDYRLPTNLLQISHPIKLLDGSSTGDSGKRLSYITKEEYDVIEPNPNRTSPDTGKPSMYTIYGGSILLTSIPDSTDYLVEINWGKIPTSLDVDSDTANFSSMWDELLKWGSLARLYAGIGLEGEGGWGNRYEAQIKNMISHTKDRHPEQWVGKMKPNEL